MPGDTWRTRQGAHGVTKARQGRERDGHGGGRGGGNGGSRGRGRGRGRGGAHSESRQRAVRGQIRGLKRLMAHRAKVMTPQERQAREEELRSLEALAVDRERRERERKLAKKYHMVKFFERRKIERRLESVGERIIRVMATEDNETSLKELKKRKEELEKDLQYVTCFPKDRPYVALYPTNGHTDTSRSQIEEIRRGIELGMYAAETEGSDEGDDSEANVGENMRVDDGDDFFLSAT